MTEREAKTKWCPHARAGQRWMATSMDVEDLNAIAVNRGNGVEEHCLCIASACMAWRLEPHANNEAPRGYCGLAGRP